MSKKGKSKKKINLISKIIFVLLLLITIGLLWIVISLGILPFKYLIPFIAIVFIIYLGIFKIIFSKRIRVWVKIFFDIICIILISILLFAYYYLNSTLHFMDRIRAGKYQLENYYVFVKTDSNIESLNDINNLGIYESGNDSYDEALNKLRTEVECNEQEYDSYVDLGNDLLNNKVDGILMSASYKDIVSEMISDFENSVKDIYIIEIKLDSGIETEKVDVTEESFNIYISGIDIYGDISMVSRSDVNMIMSINPNTHDILLTSIPRDYYVQLHGTTGSRDKLTHAGLYGINMSIETLEDLLQEEIDYYVRVNFTTLINLVDAIGGIDVYSDTSFRAWTDHSCYYNIGMMHLNGKCALAFARERHAYIDGDRHRVKNQQDVISAIVKKALSSKTLITKYTSILESMGNSFQTNMPSESIYDLINKQLDSMPSWDLDTYSLNGIDSMEGTYTFGAQQLYVMIPDESTVEEAREKIDFVMGKK